MVRAYGGVKWIVESTWWIKQGDTGWLHMIRKWIFYKHWKMPQINFH